MMFRLYKTPGRFIIEENERYFLSTAVDWDQWVNRKNLFEELKIEIAGLQAMDKDAASAFLDKVLAPIGSQEVWASGVTYLRSRDARMEESEHAKSAYDLVYDADRPELFFKSLPHRVAGPGQAVNIRRDSTWNVPEPELTLFINSQGTIAGYTIGNDMSSRSIEGENTLYLPQAKTYERSAALGPCLAIPGEPLGPETEIDLKIFRDNKCVFHGQTRLGAMKRRPEELRDYLLRGLEFNEGCFLMTGTGIVPPTTFTLEEDDLVDIRIGTIGTLSNPVKWY
ncbi:MAG TPA: fumarylacetoacetate hydrolase family protein [Saprospiraceae bacterium]|nr:fumarylacetoacetate hydrolase family protein [Saprospiraceae bacterium]HNT21941.1 fumarylacetoacetate hydrolase family protein [Saprospiraceae bacterium]